MASKKQEAWNRWWKRNKSKKRQKARRAKAMRKWRLNKEYGMTESEWELLFQSQNRRCAICKTLQPEGKGRWCVDHDHSSGEVRGILCHNCNVGIGNLQDSTTILKSAIKYLELRRG